MSDEIKIEARADGDGQTKADYEKSLADSAERNATYLAFRVEGFSVVTSQSPVPANFQSAVDLKGCILNSDPDAAHYAMRVFFVSEKRVRAPFRHPNTGAVDIYFDVRQSASVLDQLRHSQSYMTIAGLMTRQFSVRLISPVFA